MAEQTGKLASRLDNVMHVFALHDSETLIDFVKETFRDGYDGISEEYRSRLVVTDHTLLGRRWYRISAKASVPAQKTKKIMYLHGGGYIMPGGDQQANYIEFLANETGAEIWYPDYPLVPESVCMDALAMTAELYRLMLAEADAESIALMGDSAGGGLAVASALYFHEIGLPQPNNLILFSPEVSFHLTPEEGNKEEEAYFVGLQERDPWFVPNAFPVIGELWRGELDGNDHHLEVANGDLRMLPPMTVFSGTSEILNLSIRRFVEKAKEQQAQIEYFEHEGMPHVYTHFKDFDNKAENAHVVEVLRGDA